MPKEPEYYRDNLARVTEAFPDKEILTLSDVSKWWGVSSRIVSRELHLYKGQYISKASLARMMAIMHEEQKKSLR